VTKVTISDEGRSVWGDIISIFLVQGDFNWLTHVFQTMQKFWWNIPPV
jgi:hypothetical protein